LTRTHVLRIVEDAFKFLGQEGFEPPALSSDGATSVIRYVGPRFDVEVEIEFLDFFIYVLIVCPAARVNSGYYVADGKLLRQHLQSVVAGRSLFDLETERKLRAMGGDAANASLMAIVLAELLRVNIEWLNDNVVKICG